MILGHLHVEEYLKRVDGLVTGNVITDAKDRQYHQQYEHSVNGETLLVRRRDGNGDEIEVKKVIPLDESLIAFFGLYSGDGAKGSENSDEQGRIVPTISFSQKERYLVRFAVDQFQRLFPTGLRFTFSLGEDSAYFMSGPGQQRLSEHYQLTDGAPTPAARPLEEVRPRLDQKDMDYLKEHRPDVPDSNENYLAFYYQHKSAMQAILVEEKRAELASVGIVDGPGISVSASLRRPFKKGARLPGGSSRSDEIHLGGLSGIGELFLKMMHELEDSILRDSASSASGLVQWQGTPSAIGQELDLGQFFASSPYGKINGAYPEVLERRGESMVGRWRRSSEIELRPTVRLDPLWCYIAGLYLAEGSTPKVELFTMFSQAPSQLSLAFTSSEGVSIELMLRTLRKLFKKDDCLQAWKVKVGSQYFPELVVTGQKQGVPMLRGGNSGDGKLRTMEISIAIKEWALQISDAPLSGLTSILHSDYSSKFSHVEPTGAGVARIDFWASSTLCRWYFPLLMYTVFSDTYPNPLQSFYQ